MLRKRFGLLGRNISYSFSKGYFTEKFNTENLTECSYENFDIQDINNFPEIIKANSDLKGLNVTIPYKETVMPFLDELSERATKIGAINVIKITKEGKLKGYNSDYYGFKKALEPLLLPYHKKALILGTGGASKAVAYALEELGIQNIFVSRNPAENAINYSQITAAVFSENHIIINSTPLGTSPKTAEFPDIPYHFFTNKHIAFDLIYNPAETQFLKKAKEAGAIVKNGMEMLVFQAEKAWGIWNE
jgi:shikimate dehydrogenase